jgi:ABC-type phosphate transport system substrate-binding protein
MLRALVLAAAILLPASDIQPAESVRPFHVIVNSASPVSDLSRAELSAMFMKRAKSWPDGSEILPVDQAARSGLRESFSRSIHEKGSAFVGRYWQRLIFAGRGIPPPEVPSDEEVIAFVAKHRGAIGYVSRAAAMSDGVKVIVVTP